MLPSKELQKSRTLLSDSTATKLGLHCCVGFSLVEWWGPLSSYGAQASHCSSFSCGKARAQ